MNKKLRYIDVLGLVIGAIIGWGSFTLPGTKFLKEAGVINTFIGLLIGGIFIMVIQNAYHIMLESHREDGGEFTYTLNHLGKVHGFVVGWSLSLCYLSMVPLNAGAFVLLLREIFGSKMDFLYLYSISGYPIYLTDVLVMSAVILLFGFINIQGLKISTKVQNVMSILLAMIVSVLLCLMFMKSDLQAFHQNYVGNYHFSLKEISKIIAIAPFLFVGFDVVPQVSEELGFKPEKSTLLVGISVLVGIFLYGALNTIAGLGFSPDVAVKTHWAVADAVIHILGKTGFYVMLIALAAAVVGGINGFMIAASKLIASLSRRKHLGERYGIKNKKGVQPYAIIFVCAISLIGAFIGRRVIIYIVDMASVLAAVAYMYVSFISISFAKGKVEKVLSVLSVLISIGFIVLLVFPRSPARLSKGAFISLILWVFCGVLVYQFQTRKRKNS
ncbi:APC family permease [Bulleidia sp. zg-1006]|uniref:APC family permease n=1 Tax=Bulleidia sp. zg-1006 TaxID=2806552 RepID=UPI0019393899|nr:APC family permease [Bulleidia sp. zg-1006]QRG86882.1 APC family permease [Bulleidia sp. zg-1006]